MTLIRENLVPTLMILLAGLLISFAALPLQNTEWAEGIRTEGGAEGQGEEGFEREGGTSGGAVMVILPLVKVTIFMGIGGLLTALVLWSIRSFMRRGQGQQYRSEGNIE